jgi:hypothetical protein
VTGIALMAIDGLIHVSLIPHYLEYASYLGLLFVANNFGSVLSGLGINGGRPWGWPLGLPSVSSARSCSSPLLFIFDRVLLTQDRVIDLVQQSLIFSVSVGPSGLVLACW